MQRRSGANRDRAGAWLPRPHGTALPFVYNARGAKRVRDRGSVPLSSGDGTGPIVCSTPFRYTRGMQAANRTVAFSRGGASHVPRHSGRCPATRECSAGNGTLCVGRRNLACCRRCAWRSRTPTWRPFEPASTTWRTDAIGRLLISTPSFDLSWVPEDLKRTAKATSLTLMSWWISSTTMGREIRPWHPLGQKSPATGRGHSCPRAPRMRPNGKE